MGDGLIINQMIKLKIVTENDCKDLWLWRNCSEVRKKSFNSQPISWKEHKKWFYSNINSQATKTYIAYRGITKIGVIRFELYKNFIRVNVNLNPQFFGKGHGIKIIKLGTEKMIKSIKTTRCIRAEIKKDNITSIKAFSKAGYVLKSAATEKVIYEFKKTN
jgi:RimJ/RimL family protein N-acetyltransferase